MGNVYNCAATDGKSLAVILSNYSEDDFASAEKVMLEIKNLQGGAKIEIYSLDEERNGELVETREIEGNIELDIPLFTTFLVKIYN